MEYQYIFGFKRRAIYRFFATVCHVICFQEHNDFVILHGLMNTNKPGHGWGEGGGKFMGMYCCEGYGFQAV